MEPVKPNNVKFSIAEYAGCNPHNKYAIFSVDTSQWPVKRRIVSFVWRNRLEIAVIGSFIATHIAFFVFMNSEKMDNLIGKETPRPFIREAKHFKRVIKQKYENFMKPEAVEIVSEK